MIAETQDRQAATVVIDLTEREVLRVTSVRDISRLCECTWMPVYVRRRVGRMGSVPGVAGLPFPREAAVKMLKMLRARLRPLRVPDDGAPLDVGEMRVFLALSAAWKDKAGTRAVVTWERHSGIRANRRWLP